MRIKLGHYGGEGTPVPISNTEVKFFSAYDTAGLPWWESESWPSLIRIEMGHQARNMQLKLSKVPSKNLNKRLLQNTGKEYPSFDR